MKKIVSFLALMFAVMGMQAVFAQDPIYLSGDVYISAADNLEWYGDVTIGPGTNLYIEDGAEILFYGTNFTVDPAANIYAAAAGWATYGGQTGTGTIVFKQPHPGYGAGPLPTVQQTLNGGYSTGAQPSLLNIEIDNPSGVSLSGNTRVTNDIVFTNGHIFLNNQDLVLDSDATFTGYDASKYVVTNGTGHVVKEEYATAFEFPVGRATADYTPAIVTPATAETVHVQVKNYSESPSTELEVAEGMDRTWHIYGDASVAVTVSLQHNSPATDGADYTDADAFVTQYGGGNVWSVPGTTDFASTGVHVNASYTIPAGAAGNDGYFTKSSDIINPLPVTLTAFVVSREGELALLTWATAAERNADRFDVERSYSGNKWSKIGSVKSVGPGSYSFTDNNPLSQSFSSGSGEVYYRLRLVDVDGSFSNSRIRSVVFGDKVPAITSYPNPVTDRLYIKSGSNLASSFQVYDLTGRVVVSPFKSAVLTELDVSHLSSGVYILEAINKDGTSSRQRINVIR